MKQLMYWQICYSGNKIFSVFFGRQQITYYYSLTAAAGCLPSEHPKETTLAASQTGRSLVVGAEPMYNFLAGEATGGLDKNGILIQAPPQRYHLGVLFYLSPVVLSAPAAGSIK